MTWRLNRLMFPIYNLGPGTRIGIWVQGCSLACDGCVSKTLWSPRGGHEVSVEDLAHWIVTQEAFYDGVTITGGEPFEQYEAFIAFCAYLKKVSQLSIFVFSGYTLAELTENHDDLLFAKHLDFLIDGRYDRALHEDRNVRGSSNQRLYRFEEGHTIEEPLWASPGKWSVTVDRGGQVFMAGIPRHGELETITAELAEAGIDKRFV